jgi:hypothetical protein
MCNPVYKECKYHPQVKNQILLNQAANNANENLRNIALVQVPQHILDMRRNPNILNPIERLRNEAIQLREDRMLQVANAREFRFRNPNGEWERVGL